MEQDKDLENRLGAIEKKIDKLKLSVLRAATW